jgi:hypothetical protein
MTLSLIKSGKCSVRLVFSHQLQLDQWTEMYYIPIMHSNLDIFIISPDTYIIDFIELLI